MASVSPASSARELPTARILGVPIQAIRQSDVLDLCASAARARESLLIGVVNAAKLCGMLDDAALRQAVVGADLVLADGMSVVWASRLWPNPIPERVAGIDLMESLLARAESEGFSVYFLGARPAVLSEFVARVRQRHPTLAIAGARNGYWTDSEEPSIVAEIHAARADFLFVGISSPKKERFLFVHRAALGVAVCHGVGGSFDVIAGRVARAPRWMQRLGLEWLFRLVQEPRRLWERYVVTNSRFAWLVLRERIAGRGSVSPRDRSPRADRV